MISLKTEKKTVNGNRIANTKKLNQLVGFDIKEYKKLPANETFLFDGLICKNSDFTRMKIYKHKKTNDYYLIQGNMINYLIASNI